MTLVVATAIATAALNVGIAVLAERISRGREMGFYSKAQSAAILLRLIVFFGAAHTVFGLRRSTVDVTVFIFVAAVAQLVGNTYFFLKLGKRKRKDD